MTVVLCLLLAGCSGGGPAAAQRCGTPDRAPAVVRLAQPDVPPMAQQQGITGDVTVRVTLDASGGVTDTQIVQSPSAILNFSAAAAARASTYQPGLQNCRAGGTLDVTFHFTN